MYISDTVIYCEYTMTIITIESQKIDDIKNQLERLIQNGQNLESNDHKRHIRAKMEPLDKIEKDIIKYVKNNSGTSKQGVVDNVDYARMTIYRAIERLENYGIIIVELDKKNKRKHRLYVSDKSLISSVINDIGSFKKSYFNLIRIASKYYKKADNKELYSWTVSTNLISILKHLITSYSLYAVFEWPKIIKDSEGLNRLYLTVFESLNDIFAELGDSVPFHLKESNAKTEFLKSDLMSLYGEFEIYEQMIIEFHRYDLDVEFDTVMSNLFMASKMPRDWGDIRAGMEEQ